MTFYMRKWRAGATDDALLLLYHSVPRIFIGMNILEDVNNTVFHISLVLCVQKL